MTILFGNKINVYIDLTNGSIIAPRFPAFLSIWGLLYQNG